MDEDKQLYQFLGRMEGKIDTLNVQLASSAKKFDSLDDINKEQNNKIHAHGNLLSRHSAIFTIVSTILIGTVIALIRTVILS